MKTINIDGKKYIEESSINNSIVLTKKQIVVLNRGWIIVGDVLEIENSNKIQVKNCNVIRRWGTKKGLGELAEKGPLSETVLDKSPDVSFEKQNAILYMNCNEEKWI